MTKELFDLYTFYAHLSVWVYAFIAYIRLRWRTPPTISVFNTKTGCLLTALFFIFFAIIDAIIKHRGWLITEIILSAYWISLAYGPTNVLDNHNGNDNIGAR